MEPARPSPTIPGRPAPLNAPLNAAQRAFLAEPLFASLATLDPDGAPRQAVIWYRLEPDDRILVNSRAGRRWPANMQRDGRVSLAIQSADGYQWLGISGHVETVDDDTARARDDIVALAHRYHPEGPAPDDIVAFRSQARITFRIAIDGIHDHLED